MKRSLKVFTVAALLWATAAFGQVFTTLYLPTVRENPSSSLYISVAAGRVFCGTSMVNYAGGTLLMTASTTNYVYLNTASSCALAVKTTTFALGDIPIASVVAGSSTITSVTDQRTGFTKAGGSGVTSLNALTGALSLTSSDSSVIVTPSGSTINLQTTASASGVQYNPSNTAIIFTGDSENGDDWGVLGPIITVTGVNCNGTVCIFTNSGTNGLSAGDWISTGSISSPSFLNTPPSQWATATGYTIQQVISTGLTSTQFETNYTYNTGTGSGGTVEVANYYLGNLTAKTPFFNGHGVVSIQTPSTSKLSYLAANFSTVIGNAPTSPAFLVIYGAINDISACNSLSTDQGYYTSIWSQAHAAGWTVVQGNNEPYNYNATLCSSVWTTFNALNGWLRAQSKTTTTASSGQYWDYFFDAYSALSNQNDLNFRQSNGYNGPSALPILANLINNTMATQGPILATSFVIPQFITPLLGDATFNSLTQPDQTNTTALTVGVSQAGASKQSNSVTFRATHSLGLITSNLYLDSNYFLHVQGDSSHGIETSSLLGPSTAPSGTCASDLGGAVVLAQDRSITFCPVGGGTWTTFSGGSSAFSAVTSGTNTTAAMLVGSGASMAPTGTGTIQATNISGTVAVSSPITVSGSGTTVSPYTFACPTCGTGSGGTSVSQNSGSAETNLPITGYMPQVCSDTSGSGTAQSCTVANSFTPQAGNCLVYTTTTANSGTGLTVNINSLGAKSVAVSGSSGWTTTLTASLSIPANKPLNLCYDGTNWNASGTGYIPVSGSSGGLTQIGQFVISGSSTASVTFSAIPSTYTNLVLTVVGTNSSGGTDLFLRFNGDSGSNYDWYYQIFNDSGSSSQVAQSGLFSGTIANNGTNYVGNSTIRLNGYNTPFYKTMVTHAERWSGTKVDGMNVWGDWRSTSTINSIQVYNSGGTNFVAGSVITLYGEQ